MNLILTNALLKIFNKPNYKVVNIGMRHRKKIHEIIVSREERSNLIENKKHFIIKPYKRYLNYDKCYLKDQAKVTPVNDYISENSNQLSVDGLIKKIKRNINLQ
jgi:UDP-glucose 4-epimerase